jgi:UDP-N-acetylglucosamine 3-dehydrogenase
MTRDTNARRALRIGVAGLGTMGRNHLRNLLARDDIVVAAVADPSAVARGEVMAHVSPGVRDFNDPEVMLAEEDLDAIIVAVPTTLHFSVARAAISRGVATLIEKPITATIDEGRELARLAEDRNVLLQVGHVERFNPAVVALAEQLSINALGTVFSIKTIRAGPFPDRIRDVGVAIDLATHDIDIICHLLRESPRRVYAETTRHLHSVHEDLLYGLLWFDSGIVGSLDVNWLTPDKQRRVAVLGEDGMFEVDYLRQSLTFTRGSIDLAPTYLGGYAPTFTGEAVALPVEPAEPLRLELHAFISAVRSGGRSPVSAHDGLMALTLANLLLASSSETRPLPVQPSGES